jgi:predicted nucleic acid-binding protein
MYETVTIPEVVFEELLHPDAPRVVQEWAQQRPAWVEVRRVSGTVKPFALRHLDAGEREAIQIAAGDPNSLLLIDDAAGRQAAAALGITLTGTLGILRAASLMHLVDLPVALNELLKTNFRASAELIESLIAEDKARRKL